MIVVTFVFSAISFVAAGIRVMEGSYTRAMVDIVNGTFLLAIGVKSL